MLLKKLFSAKNALKFLMLSSLVSAHTIQKRQEEEEEEEEVKYIYTLGYRPLTYMSLYDANGRTLGRRVLTTSLYDNKIIDQIKDYLNNHEAAIENIDVVEMVGINETAFMIRTDIFEYGAYPMESFKAEGINYGYESGPFRWRQNQHTSSTTEWSNQSYLWGVRNYQKGLNYTESEFQKALSSNEEFPKFKELSWKCKYDEENQRCTNFDEVSAKSYDLLLLGYEKIGFPEDLMHQFRLFKNESMLYDPQIVKRFNVETKNFEEAVDWFNKTIVALRSTQKSCENTDPATVSQVHFICEYGCDHLIDSELVALDSKFTSGGIRSLPSKGLAMILAGFVTLLYHVL